MADYGHPHQLELFPLKDQPSSDRNLSPFTQRAAAPVSPSITLDEPFVAPTEQELTEQCREFANGLGLTKLARRVNVIWNQRMRTAAGRAHYRDCRIELNPSLLDLPGIDGPGEMDRTLRHELAHLVAHVRAKGRRIQPHGHEWHQACCDLGIPDESRCHSLPFQPRQVKRKFLYECPSCNSEVPRVRKFRRPVACYACCKSQAQGRYEARFRLREVLDENLSNNEVAARGASES